jgi:putative DNA primase/helicase
MATLDDVVQQMREEGLADLPLGHPVLDGKIHKFGKRKKSWYALREILLRSGQIILTGAFGMFRGDHKHIVQVKMNWEGVSPEERAAAEAKRAQLAREQEEKERRLAETAANRAKQQWEGGLREGRSPYVERKRITTTGVRFFEDGTLLVPAFQLEPVPGNTSRRLVGLQKIAADGSKLFNKGMAKQGACCPIGKVTDENSVIFLSEGYATARSIDMALESALGGYMAFDAGNLVHVARTARARHPKHHILFCADDDWQLQQRFDTWLAEDFGIAEPVPIDGIERTLAGSEGEVRIVARWCKDPNGVDYIDADLRCGRKVITPKFENAGIARAMAAAREVGNASVVWPRFQDRGDQKLTDFNDLHCTEGLDAVGEQLAGAILAAAQAQAHFGDDEPLAAPAGVSTPPAAAAGNANNEPPPWAGGGAGEPSGESGERWEFGLARGGNGNILPTLSNVFCILSNHVDWKSVIAYDEFSGQVVKLVKPPFIGAETGEWSDMDDLRCTLWLQQKFGFAPKQEVVMGAVLLVADMNKYHVVRNYLDGLVWDGTPRLDTWLVDRMGAEDSPYNRTVARKWLIAAVARIYRPGCKADNVLILEGEQGIYKSTALKVLGGEWFTDAPFRLGDKDAYVVIRGKWIVELAELDSFNKAESTGAKLFFGQYIDRYRNFYGKRATDVPRQQLFAGTTNSDTYLKDDTGNRRYWPVKVIKVDLAGLTDDRDQIWAEAVHQFRAGAEWWPTSAEKDMFEFEQDARYVGDAYTTLIRDWLVGKSTVTMPEIMGEALKLDVGKWTRPEQQRVGRCMAEIGWKRIRSPKSTATGKRDWVYQRPTGGAVTAGGDDAPL